MAAQRAVWRIKVVGGFGFNRQQPYSYVPQSYIATPAQAASLMSRVSYLLCTCLLATAGAAYLGRDMVGLQWPFIIGAFVCVFAINFTRRNQALSLALLYGLSVCEGLFLGPALNAFRVAGGGQIITEAFLLTAGTVAGIGAYIAVTGANFSFLGKFLGWAVLGLVIVGFGSLLFHGGVYATTQGTLIFSVIGAAVFVGFTLYDFSNIKNRYSPDDYVIATVALYLDFLNLFLFLIQILSILQGGGGRRR